MYRLREVIEEMDHYINYSLLETVPLSTFKQRYEEYRAFLFWQKNKRRSFI